MIRSDCSSSRWWRRSSDMQKGAFWLDRIERAQEPQAVV